MRRKPQRKQPGRRAGNDADIIVDSITGIESAIWEKIQNGRVVPHQKILSREKLASLFGASPYQIRQALARLEKKGVIYARKGSGVYLTGGALADTPSRQPVAPPVPGTTDAALPDSFLSIPHVPIFKTLKVQLPGLAEDEVQVRMWRDAFAAFNREFPFVNLEPDFSIVPAGESPDVVINAMGSFGENLPAQRPLDLNLLASGGLDLNAFVDRILDQGRAAPSRKLFALPLIRATAILAVNQRLFKRYGLADGPIVCPADWFRLGFSLVEKSGGRAFGFNYCGFHFHSAFYGVELREREGHWSFDRARLARFLEDMKPCIRRDQLLPKWSMSRFFDDSVGICCASLYVAPWIERRMGQAAHLVPLPLEPGGFVIESSMMGAVSAATENVEEATLLLGFLGSEQGQTALFKEHPEWLSVNRTVLARQKAASPYPAGAVRYEYDPRGVWSQLYPIGNFDWFLPRMETEAAKFYLGLQGLDETLDKIALGGHEMSSTRRPTQ